MTQSLSVEARATEHYAEENDLESLDCPYGCGTVLTGVYAHGNLTRHLKSQTCAASGRAKVRFPCPAPSCAKVYGRSDALRVHMRKFHAVPSISEQDIDH